MHVMLAYDNSRNARIALDAVRDLLSALNPKITLISVVEDVGSSTAGVDELFSEQYAEQKAGTEKAAAELAAAARRVLIYLCRDMPVHFDVEEEGLFPRLRIRALPEDTLEETLLG